MDSQLRLPLDSQLVRSAENDLLVVTTSAHSAERRQALESRGIQKFWWPMVRAGGPICRASSMWLGHRHYLSLMIEAGSKLNWTALESGCVDRIYFYYGPKILGGLEALPLAGGSGVGGAPMRYGSKTSRFTLYRQTNSRSRGI